jgi:hypothetical protein
LIDRPDAEVSVYFPCGLSANFNARDPTANGANGFVPEGAVGHECWFLDQILPAASVYKCEPAKAERIQAGASLRAIGRASGG